MNDFNIGNLIAVCLASVSLGMQIGVLIYVKFEDKFKGD